MKSVSRKWLNSYDDGALIKWRLDEDDFARAYYVGCIQLAKEKLLTRYH